MKHVIIGTGPAGVVAAETLRKRDRYSGILLIGEEPERPYSRMALPYHLIGNITEQGTHLRKDGAHFEQLNIELMQQRVAQLHPEQKQLQLENGERISFDKLLLATGSRPTRPPIEGMSLAGVVNCWTLADARKIITQSKPGDTVALMGAGFIGCIILEALARRGVKLTVLEMENRMVPRMMDERSGTLIKQWCENQGVTVLTSTRVSGVQEERVTVPAPIVSSTPLETQANTGFFARLFGWGKKAESAIKPTPSPQPSSKATGKLIIEMEGREPLKVDLLICATGVKANIELVKGQLAVQQGILINERLQTSHADIFAAGDVAQGRDFSTGEYSVQAIQPTAVDHGYNAALNMSGGNGIIHRGCLNMNVLDTMGLISTSFGLWDGVDGGESSAVFDANRYRYLKLEFQDDVLIGANTLGMSQHVGVLRGLIQNKTRLGKWKNKLMDDPTHIMHAWLANHVP